MRDTIAGRFELLTPIAEGGSGAVWRAHDLRRGRECAAKVLRQRDSAELLRFVREQSVDLEHPHVVAPYGWAAEDEHVAIAMELVSGGTLEAALQDNGPVADWLAEELMCQLLEALRFVHEHGWVHRDVKPANVLLEPTGSGTPVARLADFGIAVRVTDARLTHAGTVVGTPGYLPTEAYAPGNPSRTMDLYAAGVTAVRMVLPEVDLSGDPLRPEDVARLGLFGGSPLLRAGVAGLLSIVPAERTRAADQLLASLTATAATRRDRPSETVDGEPFEVFDVLEPTTERELSPVLDAARLPPGAGGTTEAPIAWHAVHRKVIAGGEHRPMAERGGDRLRPFAPVNEVTAAHAIGTGAGQDTTERLNPVEGAPAMLERHPVGTSGGASAPDRSEEITIVDPAGFTGVNPTGITAGGTATGLAARGREADTGAGGVVDPGGTADEREPHSRRAVRWPWWVLALTLALLALAAGYLWLGPVLVQWGGDPSPAQTPAPTISPTRDPEPAPTTDVTPICSKLEDGTVSCVVAP